MDILHVRVSSLPLLSACSPAATPPEISIGGPRAAADLGSAAHIAMGRAVARGGPVVAEDLEAALARYTVDRDDLDDLLRWGGTQWRKLSNFFPQPLTEVEWSWFDQENQIQLVGHADVVSVGRRKRAPQVDELRIADHKSGRLDSDHKEQLRGYCLLGLKDPKCVNVGITRAYAATLRWREQLVDGAEYTLAELESWWSEFARRLRTEADRYRPGPHCGWCPRGLTCPAKTQLMRQAVQVLRDVEPGKDLTPAQVGQLYDAIKLLNPAIEKAWELVKATVGMTPARSIPIGDGRQLRLKDQVVRDIDILVGIDLLKAKLGDKVLLDLLKIGKGDVEDAIKAGVGTGQKGKAVAAFLKELDDAGALRARRQDKLICERMAVDGQGTESAGGAAAGARELDAPASPEPAG